MTAIFSFFPVLLSVFSDIPKAIDALGTLHQMILDAEASGKSGADKLTSVLNDFEAFLGREAPSWAQPFETIATDVEAAVNAIVSIYNSFKTAAPST